MPWAALGKAFAECFWGFAECPRHIANSLYLVVQVIVRAFVPTSCYPEPLRPERSSWARRSILQQPYVNCNTFSYANATSSLIYYGH
jgi:hypothetical protein